MLLIPFLNNKKLKQLNINVTEKTGVGKRRLINAVFHGNLAETGSESLLQII